MVTILDDRVDGDGINDRRRSHLGYLIPVALDPIALFVLVSNFNAGNPPGLFHAVPIRDPNAQWITVLNGQLLAIPGIAQHNSPIGSNQIQINGFVKAIA